MKYHLLDDYNNASSFEAQGTRKLDMKRLFPPPPISPPFPPSTTPSTTSTSLRTITTTTTTVPPPPTRRPTRGRPRVTWPPKTTAPPPQNITQSPQVGGLAGMDARLSMSVTLAVGCSLLFLNIVIFAGVYYQKDRMRVEMKMRKLELEKEKEATVGAESEGIKSSTGPDSDTNSSSMATPPCPPPLNRHNPNPPPQMHANNSMPKTAIPVLPPQAPYHGGRSPRSPRLPQRPIDLQHHHHRQQQQHPQLHPHHHHMSHPDIMEDKLRHSSSADSGTDVNNHCPNPSTVV